MELPNEMVIEILSRLPIDKLCKTRALSKYHAEISHQFFYKDLAAKHGPNQEGFIFQDIDYNAYALSFASPSPNSSPFRFSLDFVPGNYRQIRATAGNGLVLVESFHPRRYSEVFYSICKPSTKQCKGIPIPKTRYFTKSIALFVVRSNPLHFKILRLSANQTLARRSSLYSHTICELFDSKTWRWKILTDITIDPSFLNLQSQFIPVHASGSAHWKNSNETSIFAFDFCSETWSTISMPTTIVEEYEDMEKNYPIATWYTELVEYKGKLGLMRKFHEWASGSTELWIMDNYLNRSWTKRNGSLESMPMAFYGSDISMALSFDDEVIFSNLETNRCNSIKVGERHYGQFRMVFPFMTDFEPWNFHPPPRTLKARAMEKIIRKQHFTQKVN